MDIYKQAKALGLWVKIVDGQYEGKKPNYQIMKDTQSLATYSTTTQVKAFFVKYMERDIES